VTLTGSILLRKTMYSCSQKKSKYFWNRYNVFYPFRPEPSSGRTMLTTAVCSVRDLRYQYIWIHLQITTQQECRKPPRFQLPWSIPAIVVMATCHHGNPTPAFTYKTPANVRAQGKPLSEDEVWIKLVILYFKAARLFFSCQWNIKAT
jgi:hypothetical protein